MSFQVLVKTTRDMTGAYSYILEDRAAAEKFVTRPDVWWYMFPLAENWEWRRGGAWTAEPEEPAVHGLFPHQVKETPSPRPVAPRTEEEDDDDRW